MKRTVVFAMLVALSFAVLAAKGPSPIAFAGMSPKTAATSLYGDTNRLGQVYGKGNLAAFKATYPTPEAFASAFCTIAEAGGHPCGEALTERTEFKVPTLTEPNQVKLASILVLTTDEELGEFFDFVSLQEGWTKGNAVRKDRFGQYLHRLAKKGGHLWLVDNKYRTPEAYGKMGLRWNAFDDEGEWIPFALIERRSHSPGIYLPIPDLVMSELEILSRKLEVVREEDVRALRADLEAFNDVIPAGLSAVRKSVDIIREQLREVANRGITRSEALKKELMGQLQEAQREVSGLTSRVRALEGVVSGPSGLAEQVQDHANFLYDEEDGLVTRIDTLDSVASGNTSSILSTWIVGGVVTGVLLLLAAAALLLGRNNKRQVTQITGTLTAYARHLGKLENRVVDVEDTLDAQLPECIVDKENEKITEEHPPVGEGPMLRGYHTSDGIHFLVPLSRNESTPKGMVQLHIPRRRGGEELIGPVMIGSIDQSVVKAFRTGRVDINESAAGSNGQHVKAAHGG